MQRAHNLAGDLALTRGHHEIQHVVKPTLGNLVLWRSVYIHENRIYVDAIRVTFFGENQVFEGESIVQFDMQKDLAGLSSSSALYEDILRFNRFSDGYLAFDPTQDHVLGDIRYSMLPVSTKPLWGIVINREKPDDHADYRTYRDNNHRVRQTFLNLLFGRCANAVC